MRRCLGCFENKRDDLEVCPFCGFVDGTPPLEEVHLGPGMILAGRYIIGKVIGYGGFGVTYIGWDAKLEQKVALKEYLPSEFSTRVPGQSSISVFNGAKSEQFASGLNKFIDEAKRLSKFQKEDGIVRIFDCIAENGTAYIIMEYLQGESLADRLMRVGTMTEKESVNILMPVMKSLEVVHSEGIIHRDIAPDNIFLTDYGEVKLIDFGAARFATTSHSRSLTVIIKPGYSAEEQYRSRGDQGPHTDVYSLAATLYKMITGETPPDALERRAKIEHAKRDALVEPHRINKKISLITENAVLNALNIQIEDRTSTVQQFIDDLAAPEPVKRVYGKIRRIDFYRLPLWLKILAPGLLVLILMFGVLLATEVISFSSLFKTDIEIPEGFTVIPYVEGFDYTTAISTLESCGLCYASGGSSIRDYIEADRIVFQYPEMGRMVPIGSIVILSISRGSGDVILPSNGISTVPSFLWSNVEDVQDDFAIAGLHTVTRFEYNASVYEGQLIRAEDGSGNLLNAGDLLPEGSTVILIVSNGSGIMSDSSAIITNDSNGSNTIVTVGESTAAYSERVNVSQSEPTANENSINNTDTQQTDNFLVVTQLQDTVGSSQQDYNVEYSEESTNISDEIVMTDTSDSESSSNTQEWDYNHDGRMNALDIIYQYDQLREAGYDDEYIQNAIEPVYQGLSNRECTT